MYIEMSGDGVDLLKHNELLKKQEKMVQLKMRSRLQV
jgi:hypothetical protein